jgi:cysteine synthase
MPACAYQLPAARAYHEMRRRRRLCWPVCDACVRACARAGGFSAGANVAAAVQLLRPGAPLEGCTVAVVVCDSGLKYLSTDLWS